GGTGRAVGLRNQLQGRERRQAPGMEARERVQAEARRDVEEVAIGDYSLGTRHRSPQHECIRANRESADRRHRPYCWAEALLALRRCGRLRRWRGTRTESPARAVSD